MQCRITHFLPLKKVHPYRYRMNVEQSIASSFMSEHQHRKPKEEIWDNESKSKRY